METPMDTMIADYMEGGFLDNIIEMFRQDPALFALLPQLMADERMRVRLGTAALVESLREEQTDRLARLVPELAALLRSPSPTVRGDVIYVLGVIGSRDAVPYLQPACEDENPGVRQLARETLVELTGNP